MGWRDFQTDIPVHNVHNVHKETHKKTLSGHSVLSVQGGDNENEIKHPPALDQLTATERQAYEGWYAVMTDEKFNMPPDEAHVEAMRRIEFSRRALRGEFGNEQETYFESVRLFGGKAQ